MKINFKEKGNMMLFRKTLSAAVALVSCHAIQCMDSYDLYKDGTFFEFIRTAQQSTSPLCRESENSSSEESSASIYVQPQQRHKRKAITAAQPKRVKTEYAVDCYMPGCATTIVKAKKHELTYSLIKHLYSKKHNSEKYNEVREYVQRNLRRNKEIYEITCMHQNCGHILRNKIPQTLTVLLMEHLYASTKHNAAELEEMKKYINKCC